MTQTNDRLAKLLKSFPTIIASSRSDKPNIAVATDVELIEEDKILIAHNEMVQTIENIKTNPNICLLILDDKQVGFRIWGQAEYHDQGPYFALCHEKFKTPTTTPQGAIIIVIAETKEIK